MAMVVNMAVIVASRLLLSPRDLDGEEVYARICRARMTWSICLEWPSNW